MPRVAQARSPARWPFWLLLGAWFCANSPQAATYAFFSWAAGARSFSHQQKLTADVAFVLAGVERPAEPAVAEGTEPSPVPPAIPASAVLKKLDLAVETVIHLASLPRALPQTLPRQLRVDGLGRSAPPHEPPRGLLVG